MHINSIPSVSFAAHIPKKLHDDLFNEALRQGHSACDEFFLQSKKIKDWGHEASSLALIEEKTPEGIKKSLGFVNGYAAPLKRVLIPVKTTIFDTFLALKEHDIQEAENKLGF